jgi:tetratricopeptide (TPR) repeat protein
MSGTGYPDWIGVSQRRRLSALLEWQPRKIFCTTWPQMSQDVTQPNLPAPEPKANQRALAVLKLLKTEDLSEARSLIEASPMLLDDDTDRSLQDILAAVPEADHLMGREVKEQERQATLDRVGWALGLLRRCREVGTAEAFAELAAGKSLDTRQALYPDELFSLTTRAYESWGKFKLTGDEGALREAIERFQALLAHPSFEKSRLLFRVFMLEQTAAAMLASYEWEGRVNELTSAIQLFARVATETPESSIDWPLRVLRLGQAYQTRFKVLRADSDLQHALKEIDAFLDVAGKVLPYDAVAEMGPWFRNAYRKTNRPEWLDREVRFYERRLSLLEPRSEQDIPLKVNIGDALRVRYEHRNDPEDLTRALSYLEEAAPRMPHSKWRPTALGNLAYVRLLQFRSKRDLGDLEKAIALLAEALSAKEYTSKEKQRSGNWLLEALLEYKAATGSDVAPGMIEAAARLVNESAGKLLLEAVDEKILAGGAESANPSSELKGGLRFFGQNKAVQRWRFEARHKRLWARIYLIVFALASLVLFGAAAIAWARVSSHWAGTAIAVVGVAIQYFAWRLSSPLSRVAAGIEEDLESLHRSLSDWDDAAARQIVADTREHGKPFALFLRGFESEAADRPLNWDAELGPQYFQVLTPQVGLLERNLKAALAAHLPAITVANPADLLIVTRGTEDHIPRIVLPIKEWGQLVSALADAALLIVMDCREFSPGVEMELAMLAHSGHARKTIIVLSDGSDHDEGLSIEWMAGLLRSRADSISPPLDKYIRATKDDARLRPFPNVVLSNELSWATIERMVKPCQLLAMIDQAPSR